MSEPTVKRQFSIDVKSIRPKEPGSVAWIALGFTIYLYKSQFNMAITLLFWRIEIYWVFRQFYASGPPKVNVNTISHINGVEITSMTREELVGTVQSMALLLYKNGTTR